MNLRFVAQSIFVIALFASLCIVSQPAAAQTYAGEVLYSFTGSGGDGASPYYGSLIMDASGNLYGTTYQGGGKNSLGTVFELINSSGAYTEKVLYAFNGYPGDGANPYGGLVMDGSGNLYGTTYSGGASNIGTVFELVNSNGTYSEKLLYSFTGGGDGRNPNAGLIMDGSGNLYGTTYYGGSGPCQYGLGCGTVFELVNSSGTYTEEVLYTFEGPSSSDGQSPLAGLVMDSAGNLYGTTINGGSSTSCSNGCGMVFELANSSGTYSEKVLYSFTGSGGDGSYPYAGLIADTSGNLYGTTYYGGANSRGTVFELVNSSGAYSEKILYCFAAGYGDGAYPFASLIMDGSGNLYGTTAEGGSSYSGSVFELASVSGGYSEAVLYSFQSSGSQPEAGLVMDGSGNLYGTTSYGGTNNYGTVFELGNTHGAGTTTTTSVSSSATPVTAGYPVTFTATVTSPSGFAPTGTVTFFEGSTPLSSAILLNHGTVTFTLTDAVALGLGTYTISAQYAPSQPAFAASSGTFSQTVTEAGAVLANGNNTLTGTETVNGAVDATTFAGNGAGLTNVSASGISCTGCIGNMQLGINYAGSSSQGGAASNALMLGGLLPSAFQPAGSYATLGGNIFSGAQSITGNLTVTGNASTTGTTTLGTGGTPIVEHLSKQFNPTLTLGSGQVCASEVFTYAGTSNGDTVALGVPNQRMDVGDVIYTAWVSATNKVTIKVCAFATKPTNFGSGLIRVDVWKH